MSELDYELKNETEYHLYDKNKDDNKISVIHTCYASAYQVIVLAPTGFSA